MRNIGARQKLIQQECLVRKLDRLYKLDELWLGNNADKVVDHGTLAYRHNRRHSTNLVSTGVNAP